MQSGSITPPPTPPRVAFDPPLFLQRRTAVFDVLTKVHQHPRFQGKLKSLLDVGCGEECLLVSSLIAQNDELPLEQVTGIDIDDGILDPTLIESLGPNGLHVTDEGRWRRFGLTMLHGTFEQLSLQNLAHHDIIVSAEVIEHLDPGPLSNFAPVLLGRLRPRVCVVTTPNRDFNDLFSLPFTPEVSDVQEPAQSSTIGLGEVVDPINLPPPQATVLLTPSAHEQAWRALSPGDVCSSGDRYWRAGVPYGMRHPDHRFEWTRQEFRDWALKAAEDFGYDVTFSGVGGLGNGMCVVGSTGWAVGDALARGCGYDSTGENAPDQKDEGVLTKANEVWGDCSQIAIFTIKEDEEEGSADYVDMLDWSKQNPTEPSTATSVSPLNPIIFPNPITQIVHHDFPYETDEIFPPSYVTVMELLEKELANYLPNKIREQWSKSSMEIMQDEFRGKKHNHNEDYLYESDSECDYNWNPEVDGDEAARLLRKKERRYEKGIRNEIEGSILAGKHPELIKVVKVTGVTLKQLWQSSVGGKKGLRRLCRFREDVFKDIMMKGWKVQVGADLVGDKADGGSFCKSIIDTTGSNKDIGTGGEFKGQSLGVRRQMSFSPPAGAVGIEFASITSTPVKAGQQLYSPSCSASRQRRKSLLIETPLNSSSPLQPIEKLPDPVLSSHIFTSFDCPSSSTSFEELKVSGENATPSEVISRPRSCSMPPSPTIPHATATDSSTDSVPPSPSRLPFNRSQSADQVPSSSPKPSGPQELPLQLDSDINMVVKIFSVSATRSVIDLIRRDLTEQDKEILKLWRVVKVEFNAQSIEPSPAEVVEREPVATPGRVHWHDDSVDPFSNDPLGSDEDWENSPMPPPFGDIHHGDEWDSWHIDFSPPDIVLDFPTPDEPLENAFDNMSIASHQSLPYSVDEFGTAADAEASPWAGNPALEATAHKYHTELIYPLNTVNTLLSIDKGKPREKEPLQADLKGFLIAYKALESNDQGFLNVDWKEYIKSKERVGRWMEERRRAVQDYKESERIMVAAGFKSDAIPARKPLCSWPDWLAKVEKQEEEDGMADDSAEELFAGVVVFRPFGKGGVEEGMPGEKRDHVTMPPVFGGGRKPQVFGTTGMPLNMPDEFAGWSGF